jgi:flagellin
MTAINTNTGSLYAQQSLNTNARGLATVMQQLSTGKRINNAVDDVAGLAISTRLTSQIKGLNQAVRNANDGISLIQTAEGSTEQVTNMLQRMRELAVQASNDTNNDKDRGFLNGEFQQLRSEIDRIAQNTQWNGANILDGTGGNGHDGTFSFQIGANSRQVIEIKLPNLQTGLGTDPTGAIGKTITAPHKVEFDFAAIQTKADLSNADAQSLLGAVVQVNLDGAKFQYQISQEDITAHLAGTTDIQDAVANGFATKFHAAYGAGAENYTIVAGTGKVSLDNSVAANSKGADFLAADAGGHTAPTVGYVVGELSAIGGSKIMITSAETAYAGLQAIDSALQSVNAQRSNMGALISRLQFASDNLSNVAAKATESRSRIEDTDYSVATTELAKRNIIQQAAQAMLAQANQAPQMVLQLLK